MLGSCVLFVLLSIVYVGALFEVQTPFVCKSWFKEVCLMILMFLYLFFCVQLFWELNPNKAKPLKFGTCRMNNQNVQKVQEEGPWFGH
jgi:hypothetical protein